MSLLADNSPGYSILTGGEWSPVGGTSAGAPLMAGGVAVLNSALKAHHKGRVGYLNPLLYRLGRNRAIQSEIYTDVTTGNNDTMWQVNGVSYEGYLPEPNPRFDAKPGFDAATGWGSPKFPDLLEEIEKRR